MTIGRFAAIVVNMGVFGLGLCNSTFSQTEPLEESWRWAKFTTSSGLPSNIIREIKDGPDGTPWVLTAGGLAWYDGFQWHTVDATRRIAAKGMGGIIGFFDEWVVMNIKAEYYLVSRSGLTPFPIDSLNGVWIINQDAAIVTRTGSVHVYAHGVLRPLPVPSWGDGTYIAGMSAQGQILLLKGNRAFFWDGKDLIPFIQVKGSKLSVSTALWNSSNQAIALINYPPSHKGIWEWTGTERARRDAFRTVRLGLLAALAENGEAMVVYENSFVRLRRNGKWTTIRLPDFVRDVTSIRYRLNGDVWVATLHGLFLCRLSSQRWTLHSWEESDLRNRVNNILRSRDGTLWLATTGGIVRILRNGRSVSDRTIAGKPIRIVTGLAEDPEGHIWISSGGDFPGAYRWDGRAWRRYPIRYHGKDVQIHRIVCDSRGRLWFLSMTSGLVPWISENPGVFIFENGEIKRWRESDGLPHQRVYSFAEGSNGALWFGTYDGLARWEDGKWRVWRRFSGPVSGPVTTIDVDGLNRVWFGMQYQGMGLGLLDPSGTIRYLTTLDGLPDDCVWDIKVDAKQKVWVTTQKGVACYDQNMWLTFDERTGLSETIIWPLLPEDSVVHVGTSTSGWATLHLSETQAANPRIVMSQPVIEHDDALLGWQAFTAGGAVSPEDILTRYRISGGKWSAWTSTHSLILNDISPGDYTLQVQAKGLFGQYSVAGKSISFAVPPPLVQRWTFFVPATMIGVVIFALSLLLIQRRKKYVRELGRSESRYRMITELMSDYAYLFRVRTDATLELVWMTDSFTRLTGYPVGMATEPDLMQRLIHPDDLDQALRDHRRLLDGEQLHIEHRIVTRSGKTVWVERRSSPVLDKDGNRVEYIYGVVSDITARKEGEQRLRSLAGDLVQTEERERRRMATFLHDVIGQTLTLTYLKLHQWEKREHPLDRTLGEIRGMLDQALQDAQTLTFDLCPPIIYELSLGEALAWLVARLNKQHDVAIQTDIAEGKIFVASELHVMLFQAVRELLVNSVKHAEADRIRLELHRTNGRVRIVVSDDGVGFDPRTSGERTGARGGFGLFNIRERLSDFGAELEIETVPGSGTQITISVDAA